tara:strand:- start:107 stop:280 length:174 start_codon:yes stop_codon:yes gene_type:complete
MRKKLTYKEKYEKAKKQLAIKQKALKAKALKYMAAKVRCLELEAELENIRRNYELGD